MKILGEIENLEDLDLTGVYIYYYFVEPRRLWYFAKGITMEHNSDNVEIGRIIAETTYKRERKEIQIGRIKIDFYRKELEIHEVKKSSKFKEASYWQLVYYLWVLKKLGVKCKGVLNFPKERRTIKVVLTKAIEDKLKKVIKDIRRIINLSKPPTTNKIIKNSAYYELFMA